MKKTIRIMILCAASLILLILAGCSAGFNSISVDTVLTVDKNFNGNRVMTADIPAVIYKSAFGSNINKLEQVISKYTPGDMYCKASETALGGAQISMHLDFASLTQYQEEITAICSANKADDAVTSPSVSFDYSNSLLKKGYTVSENFTSLDLFYWLSDAIKTEYPSVKKDDLENIFVSGSTRLVLNNQEIDLNGSDKIQASDIESHAFEGINIETTVNSDNTIDANIRYSVGSKIVSELGDKLDTLMKGLVPKDGSLSSSNSESGGRSYRIKFSSGTADGFVTAMNKALASNNTVFSVSTKGNADSLSVKETYKMYYDGSYFLDYNDKNTSFTYVLRVPSNYSLESYNDKYGFLTASDSTYSDNMCEISMALSEPDQLELVLGYIVDLDSINISTYVHNDIKIDRSISFKLTKEADSFIGDSIKAVLDAAVKKWPDKMSAKKNKLISSVEYSITMKAESFAEMTQMTRAILLEDVQKDANANEDGQPEYSKLSGGAQKPSDPLKKYYDVTDTINFSKFLKGSKATEGIQYKLTYPLHYKAGFNGNTSFENASVEGQTISCTSYNKVISVSSSAVKWNFEGIAVLILWIASLAVAATIIFFDFTHILAFFRDHMIDVDGETLFKGKNMLRLVFLSGSLVCFVIMSIRLIFRVY